MDELRACGILGKKLTSLPFSFERRRSDVSNDAKLVCRDISIRNVVDNFAVDLILFFIPVSFKLTFTKKMIGNMQGRSTLSWRALNELLSVLIVRFHFFLIKKIEILPKSYMCFTESIIAEETLNIVNNNIFNHHSIN